MRIEMQKNFKSILNNEFKYIPSQSTDVLRTWEKAGWKQPSQVRNDYLFGKFK